jgi:hypothetical protein
VFKQQCKFKAIIIVSTLQTKVLSNGQKVFDSFISSYIER